MRPFDTSKWNRINHFKFYRDFSDPCFNLCCQVDVTAAVKYAKQHKLSLFLLLLYLSNKATNKIQAFKLRLSPDNQVGIIDNINASATLLKADDSFNFCHFQHYPDLETFLTQAQIKRQQAMQQPALIDVSDAKNQVYYSVIPWLEFTSFKHATTTGFTDIPKIVFGKINRRGLDSEHSAPSMMPVSVELHHALADGIDIAKYIKMFGQEIAELAD